MGDLALPRSQPLLGFNQLLMLAEEQGEQAFTIQLLQVEKVGFHGLNIAWILALR
jgi:hypothetical protein